MPDIILEPQYRFGLGERFRLGSCSFVRRSTIAREIVLALDRGLACRKVSLFLVVLFFAVSV